MRCCCCLGFGSGSRRAAGAGRSDRQAVSLVDEECRARRNLPRLQPRPPTALRRLSLPHPWNAPLPPRRRSPRTDTQAPRQRTARDTRTGRKRGRRGAANIRCCYCLGFDPGPRIVVTALLEQAGQIDLEFSSVNVYCRIHSYRAPGAPRTHRCPLACIGCGTFCLRIWGYHRGTSFGQGSLRRRVVLDSSLLANTDATLQGLLQLNALMLVQPKRNDEAETR